MLESPNCYENYWCYDFIDVFNNATIATSYESRHGKGFYESMYGKGFTYAQSIVRYELEEHEKRKAANPSMHRDCTTCLALSSTDDSRML
jgi:hypothetical protein